MLHPDWKACEICHIFVYKKDVHIHQKHCVGEVSQQTYSLPHGFICNNILHALIDISKEKLCLSSSYLPLVFMHPTTMKLFQFTVNENIVLINGNSSSVFRVWPNTTTHPSNVSVPEKQIIKVRKGDHFSVHRYSDILKRATLAKELHITSDKSEEYMHSHDFRNFMLQELRNVFVCCGTVLNFNYKGKVSEFKIINIRTPFEEIVASKNCDVNELSTQLLDLNLQDELSLKTNIYLTSTKRPLVREANQHLKCSTPISSKAAPMTINEISRLSLSSEIEDCQRSHRYFVTSARTKIIFKDKFESMKKKLFFKDIGGLGKQIEDIRSHCPFLSSNCVISGKSIPKGIILFGPSGTGKSLVVKAIANESLVPVIFLERNQVFNRESGGVITNLRKAFNHVSQRAPCILILDEFHTLYKNNSEENLTSEEKSIADEIPRLIERLPSSGHKKVIVIATTNKLQCLDSLLMRAGRFEEQIEFFIPGISERKQIFKKLLSDITNSLLEEDITKIINSSHGFTGADLQKVCREAVLQSRLRSHKVYDIVGKETTNKIAVITKLDFVNSLAKVKPNMMKQYAIEVPKVHWSDIGGLHEVKEQIMDMTVRPLKHPEAFEAYGITPSRGVLLYGPPGCSKTMIAKAVATESQLNFISVKGPELFNKFVGESEGAIRSLFRKAEASSPCIIFFDEIDSLAAERESSSSGSNVGERVLTQLLTEIDGINVKKGICIIAATNRPDLLDPAFLRPGRFDSVMYVPLPDELTRKEILQIKFEKVPLSTDIDIEYLVQEMEGYSGAEILTVCKEAAMQVIFEDVESAVTAVITMSHFKEALKLIKPRTPKELITIYENFKSQYYRLQSLQ